MTDSQSHLKVSVTARVFAKGIDLVIAFLVAAILPQVIGPLIGFLYTLFADGFHFEGWRGQSVGKKILGLQVVNTVKKAPAQYKDSVIRNSPVGLATFFGIIPVWGWIILGLIGIPLMIMEVYLMRKVEHGFRLGDVMADTQVIKVTNNGESVDSKREETNQTSFESKFDDVKKNNDNPKKDAKA